MAEGWSVETANAFLSAVFQQVSVSYSEVWVQLHVGAPGADGTDNVAVNDALVEASDCFGTAPVGGSITNDADIGPWSNVPATEDYTHASLWSSNSFSATFIGSGLLTVPSVTVGDDFTLFAGDVTASLPVAS